MLTSTMQRTRNITSKLQQNCKHNLDTYKNRTKYFQKQFNTVRTSEKVAPNYWAPELHRKTIMKERQCANKGR